MAAIDFLCQPDPNSRHEECDGRRLVKEGTYQYFLPQFDRYQKIKNNDDLREQNRVRQARHRAKAKDPIDHMTDEDTKRSLDAVKQAVEHSQSQQASNPATDTAPST